MAVILPTFDLVSLGNGTVGTEAWVDICSFGPNTNSPIPNAKQLWLGFLTVIAEDKALIFEVRPNLPTKSAGTLADTQLRALASVTTGDSKDMDLFFDGLVTTFAPVSQQSTGVEKLWLRVRSTSANTGGYAFILYYTLY